jgi:GT2 family glycosyltransferase
MIVPTILKRKDLLERMLQSVDHSVDRLVFVVNDLSDWTWQSKSEQFGSVHYIRPILGLGNHGGINAGIAQTPEAPWWLFVTDDLQFGPGDLDEIVAMVEDSDEPVLVTGTYDMPKGLSFCYGALNRGCVEKVGFIDEWTFYPIYYGDNDYRWRCRLADVEWIEFDGDIHHGDDDSTSATLKSSQQFNERNQVTFPMNGQAYLEKWGGPVFHERFQTPWNLPVPLDYTRIDFQARTDRKW